jgi:cellulose synthase/poly-beta-1,6-N-acetylglucosamine synthase-like glycosyltransferase
MALIIINTILISVLGGFMLYLASLSMMSLFTKKHKNFTAKLLRQFAVVIPAHNEENSIKSTIESLLKIDYPTDLFNIIVVADNCTDRTYEIGSSLGVTVLKRDNSLKRGKGYALRWCFDIILNPPYKFDAIAIIDADTVVSANYLRVINYYLENGSRAIQTNDMVVPQPGAWSSEMTRLGFTLYNFVRPLGRKLFNGTAGIRGNGMCFKSDTLKTVPWNTYSLTEDLEYGIILFLNGINVDFAPETTIYAIMPTQEKNAETQRTRWEKGRFPIVKRYSLPLLKNAVKSLSFKYCDLFLELIIPPFVNLFSGVLLICFINLMLLIFNIQYALTFFIIWIIIAFLGVLHVIAGLISARADKNLYIVLIQIPRYVIWKLILYTKRFLKKSTPEWIRTERE